MVALRQPLISLTRITLLGRHGKTPAGDRKWCVLFHFCRTSPIGSYAGSHLQTLSPICGGTGRRPIPVAREGPLVRSLHRPPATLAFWRTLRRLWKSSTYPGVVAGDSACRRMRRASVLLPSAHKCPAAGGRTGAGHFTSAEKAKIKRRQ